MKRIWILVAGILMSGFLFAQDLHQGEPAIVYYSPKTTVVLDFQYTEETKEQGIYAEYAEELLGIKNAVLIDQTIYTLKDVMIRTKTTADLTRAHKVPADPEMPLQLLSINERGLLTGYNLPSEAKESPRPQQPKEHKHHTTKPVLPLPEEIMEAKSIEEEAQLVAKHIFRLRETRMYLLSGELEHTPADGKAMQLVLDELANQEKQLTELFTGTVKHTTRHHLFEECPKASDGKEKEIVLYFSPENGFTDAENIDAEPVYVHASYSYQHLQPATEEPVTTSKKGNKHAAVEPSAIVYNLPGHADIEVRYNGLALGAKVLPIAQFGVDVPLPKDLFTDKELPQIRVSEKTGSILSISK